MAWKEFVYRLQSVAFRRLIFQVHMWVGLGAGLYVLVIAVTGASLVFRSEMQQVAYPELFRAARNGRPLAEPSVVVDAVRAAYPSDRLTGIDWPTARRQTFLAYVVNGARFRTVFADPITGRVLGELPEQSLLRRVQELHFNLLAGTTGRTINGVGALCLLALSITGLIVWWPGQATWRRATTVSFRRSSNRIIWETHGALGFWSAAFVFMWAVTGAYFAFPQPFRSIVSVLSPVTTAVRPPVSDLALKGRAPALDVASFIARAQRAVPDAELARVILPATDRSPFIVMLATVTHADLDSSDEVSIYFDQYSGELLEKREPFGQTAGDRVIASMAPLHIGTFGGRAVQILWAILGLAPACLFGTAVVMWWNRQTQRALDNTPRVGGKVGC